MNLQAYLRNDLESLHLRSDVPVLQALPCYTANLCCGLDRDGMWPSCVSRYDLQLSFQSSSCHATPALQRGKAAPALGAVVFGVLAVAVLRRV